MKRFILAELLAWKSLNDRRKPLVLRGARQVGKSYLIKKLLAPHFESFVEINLEKQPEYRSVFEGNLEPKMLLTQLQVLTKSDIIPGKTLLFIDEIQAVPRALIALRYFYEELPALHVIAAGSLLEFAIEKVGVPVGRISFQHIAPLTFEEFLLNSGNEIFLEMLETHDFLTPVSSAVHERGLELLAEYLAIGGMPEVINNFIETKDYRTCETLQAEILESFRNDFPKYTQRDAQLKYIALVFERVPHLLMQPFKFVQIAPDIQAIHLRNAIDTLRKAGVLNLVYKSGQLQAAAGYDPDTYKLAFLDIGLAQRAFGLPIAEWIKNRHQLLKQGNITEQFIAQEIAAQGSWNTGELYYWQRNAKGSTAEVDFLIPIRNKVTPVEVKSGTTGSLKSLHLFLKSNPEVNYAIKTSSNNFSVMDKIRSVPLYAFPAWLRRARKEQ